MTFCLCFTQKPLHHRQRGPADNEKLSPAQIINKNGKQRKIPISVAEKQAELVGAEGKGDRANLTS